MNLDCVLCCEQTKLFGITECNHGPFCYRCIYKIRAINKNNACPICKHLSKQIMISQQFNKFGSYKGQILPDSNFGDVFHCGKQAKKQFQKLKQYKCFVKMSGKACKTDKAFDNIAFLKKHLKQQHKRVLCDVCLQTKTCILQQQKLYTVAQLNKHMERGDVDDFGNIVFMHPYCGFCKVYFFDEDQFKRHMSLQHMICNVCGVENKYIFYKDYQGLENHYKISHYLCSDANCLAKKFIAFRSAEEMKVHKAEVHSIGNMKRVDAKQLCGFNYGGVSAEEPIQIKDKQGINMQDQFLTLKKAKNKAIGEADQQHDAVIDLRYFYPCQPDEDQHYHDAFILKHKNSQQKQKQKDAGNAGQKKKKYVQKQQFQKQKPQFAKQNQNFTIEQLSLVKTLHAPKIYYDDFEDKLATLVSNDDLKKLQSWRVKHNKRHMTTEHFVQHFFELMKKVSLKSGYQIFPHYIRTVQNQDAKQELDQQYARCLKRLPTKANNLISQSKTYGDLFKRLLKQIEINIEHRISEQTLSIKKPIRRQKQRLLQLIGVVRRLKIQQMARFTFANNFGVQQDTSEMIHEKVFKMSEQNIQQKLSKVPNEQFLDLYIFVKYCYEAITHSENMHLSKNKIHELILQDFLFDRPHLQKQFGQKKEQLKTIDEKVKFQKEEQQRNQKKKLKDIEKKNKDMGYHAKANFSLSDKSDFPDLVVNKKAHEVKEDFKQVIESVKNKPVTYQKKINELFPVLGQENRAQKQDKKQQKPAQKKQLAWWQKINKPKYEQIQQQEVVKIRKGKNKKEKWVQAKGLFGQ